MNNKAYHLDNFGNLRVNTWCFDMIACNSTVTLYQPIVRWQFRNSSIQWENVSKYTNKLSEFIYSAGG